MVDSNNLLDPSLDISGSLTQKNDLVQSEEALKLGSRISGQFGIHASIVNSSGIVTISGLTGITTNSVGRYLTLSGANNSANNGNFLIQNINSSTSVNIKNPNAVSDANNGNISWVERNVYSLQDDLNYERTDRSEIKGVNYSDPVPTYYKVNDLTTPVKANLANIAGNTTDAKSLIINRKFENAATVIGSTYILVSGNAGDFPYATALNKLGLPIIDGYDVGNISGCYCEIINPSSGQELKVLTGIHAGERIFGLSREGSSGVDGQSFEVELRSVPIGEPISNSSVYTWEIGLPSIIDIFYPFRESLAQMNESALRVTLVNGLFAEGGSGGSGDGYFGGISAGTQLASSGFVTFVNSNGISFGMSNSGLITASYTVPSTAGLISRVNVSAGTTSNNLTNFVFSNSNGVSFGLNGSTVTASVLNQTSLSFSNQNGVSFGLNGSTLTASVAAQTAQTQSNVQGISAGAAVARTGDVVFSNSNGLSFGLNGNTLTGSYTVPTQTAFVLSNSNGISFGTNGSTVTATYTVPSTAGLISAINVSGGTTSNNLTAVTFSNSNGLSFGLNGSVITGSYTVPTQTNQTEGLYAIGNTTGQSSSSTFDARSMSFSGAGNVSIGYSGNALIISATGGGGNGSVNLSAGTTSNNLTNFVFSNSNGVSFGLNGSTVTGSYSTLVFSNSNGISFGINNGTLTATVNPGAAAGIAAIQGGTQTATSGTVSFVDSNGISFGMSGSSRITASYTVPSTAGLISAINVSGGTTSNNLSALTFSNANNVSFGLNGSTLTASVPTQTAFVLSNSNGISFGTNGSTVTATYTVPTQTNQTVGLYALGNTTQNSSTTLDARTLSFNGLGAATVGYSNGSIQISVPIQTAQTQSNIQAVYDGVNSISTGTIRYSNANGVSFGINGQTLTGSVAAQTAQTVGLYGLGNTTQNSSTTLDARSLSFNGLGNITVGYSNGSIQISASQTVQTQNVVAPSAGTQTATSGTVIFSNSNGISFGMSNSSIITASYTVPSTVGLISNINVSAGTTSNNLSAVTFSNSNGLSFGLNGSVITGSYTVPTQTVQTEGLYAIGNTTGQSSSSTFDARTMSFSGAGNISLGYSGNALVVSGSQSAQTQNIVVPSAGTQTASSGTVVFANSNGLTFGMSGSSQITGSYTVPSTAGLISAINVSAGTTSNNLNAITFSNSNGISFGLNASTITASYTIPTQTNQTEGLYAVGNTTGQSSSSTFDARTMSFSGAGIASVGYSAGNIIISVPAAGANINVSAGTTSGNIGAVTFSNSNGVSFGLNNGVITATVTPGAAAGIAAVQGGTQTQTSGTLIFSNSNGISFGLSNSSVMTASYTVPSTAGLISNINVSAGTTSNNLSAVTFSNSNGLSFGLNGSVITGSYTVPTQTNQTVGGYAVGNTTGQSSSSTFDARSLSFQGTGNISIGYSNGSVVISGAGGGGSVNISAGTTSNNLTNFVFSNSNNVSFGLNGSTVTATISVPAQTAQTVGLYALGNTTQNSSTTLDARTLSFNGLGAATVGYSNGSIQVSVPVQTAQTQSNIQAIYDGANSISTGTIRYSNANGVSFGINGQTLTGSVAAQTAQTIGLYALGNTTQNSSTTLDARTLSFNGLGGATVGYSNGSIQVSAVTTAGLISAINVSAGTTSNNLTAVTFSNSNGLSFGLNGSVVTGSYTVPTQTVQTAGLYALGNTTQNSSTTLDVRSLSFNGLGIVTAGYSNGSIQISAVQTVQTQNVVAPSAGTQTATSGTVVFSNSNGISFGMSNSSVITASYTVPSTAGLISAINVSAGTTSNNLTAVTFSNSNGLSFGLNGSTITGSYTVPTQTVQTVGLYAVSNTTGASSSSTFDARSISFQGAGVASVGYTNGSVVISVPAAGNGSVNISAGTTSNNLTNFVFSNSNNVSFGLNGSTVTATISVPAQTAQTIGLYALGNTTQNSSTTLDARTLSFNGLGGATVGYSNGSIQISAVTTAGLISAINVSAGTTSNNLTAVTFSNSNGLSFGLNGSVVTGSYTVPTQTVQTAGLYALGNTTQNSSTTLDVRSLSFNGLGAATVGYSNGSIQVSVPTQTAFVLSNSNGISFGTNGSTVTATYTVPTQTNQTVGLYALGNTTQNSSTTLDARTLSFNGLGIVTAGYSNGSIQISAVQTNQTAGLYAVGNTVGQSSSSTFDARTLSFSGAGIASVGYSAGNVIISVPSAGANINVSAGTTSNNLNAITFSNSNGISFGLNASTLTASYTVPTQTVQTIGLYALGNTTQNSSTTLDARTLSFNGLGAATVGYSNGSIQVSVPVQTAQTQSNIQAIYDGVNSISTGTIRFTNANGVSFGINGQTISGSVAAQTNQTVGLYAVSNTTGASSSTTIDARSLSFQGAGIASVGYTNGSVIVSVPSGGGGITNVNVSAGTTSNNLSAFVFSNSNSVSFGLNGSTVTASIPSQTFVFSNSNNISFGVNGSTITASVSRQQVSQLHWPETPWQTNFAVSNASFSLQHFNAKIDILATQANLLMALTGATNSSGALTVSLGIYTMAGSTMSLASSDSKVISWTSGSQTTTGSVYGGVSGTRYRTVGLNSWSLTAGDYVLGMWFRTTNNGTWNAFGVQGPTIVGALDANETNNYGNGYSTSSFSTAMIGSVNVTNTNYVRTGGPALQQPGIIFLGSF